MEKIRIGKIVNVTGLKGEVKVYSYAENPDRYEKTDGIYIGDDYRKIEHVRYQKNMVILKLEGTNSREEAEKLRDTYVYISEDSLEELPEGQFYVKDLKGLEVKSRDGKRIGVLEDIIKNAAQDIYQIRTDTSNTVLMPAVSEFIKEINPSGGFITVDPPEGLFEIYEKKE